MNTEDTIQELHTLNLSIAYVDTCSTFWDQLGMELREQRAETLAKLGKLIDDRQLVVPL